MCIISANKHYLGNKSFRPISFHVIISHRFMCNCILCWGRTQEIDTLTEFTLPHASFHSIIVIWLCIILFAIPCLSLFSGIRVSRVSRANATFHRFPPYEHFPFPCRPSPPPPIFLSLNAISLLLFNDDGDGGHRRIRAWEYRVGKMGKEEPFFHLLERSLYYM